VLSGAIARTVGEDVSLGSGSMASAQTVPFVPTTPRRGSRRADCLAAIKLYAFA
jgi:hypothetical protein